MTTFITSQPLDNIATTSSEFGERIKPKPSASSNHKGIDFPASKNTKVYASHSGIVVKAGSASGLGNVIVIKDSVTGKGTLYAHLNSLSTIIDAETGISETIKVGSSINSGTQIALSGNTGAASDGPHLHFAILDAKSVNKIKQNQTPTSLGAYSSELTWENPREHLAEAFPNTFSKAVPSGELGIDLTGDYRDNQMVGNRNNNNMYGLGGTDTYIFTTPFGSDQIIDSDFDGKIQINKVVLSGEAQPKTDKDGNEIEGQYSLNGYDLVRSGSDLVITKAGTITNLNRLSGDVLANAISSTSNKITIQNFPFEQDKAFGISLGKTKDLYVDGNGELVSRSGYDYSEKIFDDYSSPVPIIKTTDKRERFFAPFYKNEGYDSDRYYGGYYYLSTFDSKGNEVSREGLGSSLPTTRIGGTYNCGDFYLTTFTATDQGIVSSDDDFGSEVGICMIGDDGKIIAKKVFESVVGNVIEQSGYYLYLTAISFENDDEYSFHFSKTDFSTIRNGQFVRSFFKQKFSKTDLTAIGEIEQEGEGLFPINYGSSFSNKITLEEGTVIELNNEQSTGYRYFAIQSPKLRSLTPDEIVPNYQIGSGSQQTNKDLKQCQLTIQNELESSLKICLNPNSVTVINGFGSSDNPTSRIDLSDFPEIDQNYLQSNTYSTTTSEYSIDDLLKGKFEVSNNEERRRLLTDRNYYQTDKTDSDLPSTQSFRKLQTNSSGGNYTGNYTSSDDYYEDSANVTSKNYLTEKEQELSVLLLPGNQTIVFTDVKKSNLTESLGSYFTGVEGLPDFNVSESSTNNPTYSPTAIDSQSPTQLPSDNQISPAPTFESTFTPSYIPTSAPIQNPTYTPTSSKAQLPTPSPTNSETNFNSSNNTNSPTPIDWPENNQNNYPFGLTKEQVIYGGAGAGGAVALAGVGLYLAKKWWNKGKESGNKETNQIEELGNENNPEEKETRMENKKMSVEMIESKQEETNNPNSSMKGHNVRKLSGNGNSKTNSLSNV